MKKSILLFCLLYALCICSSFAQTNTGSPEAPNCYLKWLKKFEERGADDIADGTYIDIIITFRSGTSAQCFNGKVEVKENKVLSYAIRREDGSYEIVKKKLKFDGPVPIHSGVSQTMLTTEDELINIMFVKKIRPKKAGFSKAPDPNDD